METREELLNGLYYVKNKITEITNLCQQEVEIERRFRSEYKEVKVLSMKTILTMFCIAFGIIAMLMGGKLTIFAAIALGVIKLIKGSVPKSLLFILAFPIVDAFWMVCKAIQAGGLIGWLILMVFFSAIIVGIIAIFNVYAKSENKKIIAQNEVFYAQYDEVEARLKQQRSELSKNTRNWFPKSYYNMYAINWFINAVENFRCNTVSELVREFEQSEYQRQMLNGQQQLQQQIQDGFSAVISNQQQIQKQLQFANVMSVMNFAAQLNTQRRIDEQGDRIVNAINRKTMYD